MSRGGGLVAGFLLYLLLLAGLVFAGAVERSASHAPRVIHADWPPCFTPKGPPLLQQPMPKIDRDPHRPTDGGVA